MKTKLTLIILLFLASFTGFAQNYDIENIRAAVLSPHNNQAYFFVGKNKVYQYDPKTRKRTIRPLGKGSNHAFNGLSTASNVDAAFVNPTTKKIFLFKGNNWHRYNMRDGKKERTGIIGSDGFKGLSGPFDGAIAHGTSGNYAFFKGSKVYIYNPKTDKVQYSGTIGANNVYKGVPLNIDGVIKWTNGKVYFFKGDYYYRYDSKKLMVDNSKQVTGRVGFKNLFPRIDAAFVQSSHPKIKYNGAKAFYKSIYYESPDEANINAISYLWENKHSGTQYSLSEVINNTFLTVTRFGNSHFEGVPPNVDAVLEHYETDLPYFLKDSKYYRYNPKTRKVDQIGDIKTVWKGLPTDIDAAFSDYDGHHYFFKKDRFWKYNYKTKRLDKGNRIKSAFRGVPNFLDAAIVTRIRIYFYKKNTEYMYDRSKRKVVAWKSIAKIAE